MYDGDNDEHIIINISNIIEYRIHKIPGWALV